MSAAVRTEAASRGLADRYLASRPARVVAAVLAALGAWALVVGIPGLQRLLPYRIDLDVYRTGGQVFRSGGDLYGELPELAQGSHLPFTYPPLSAEVFSLLTYVPLPVASVLVSLLTVGVLAGVVYLLLGAVGGRPARDRAWLTVAVLAVGLWFGPVRETLGFGQVNVLLMGLVLLDCLRGRGRWWGGVLVGLAIAIKLTPAVFLLYFVLRRDWRSAVTTVLSAAAFTGFGHLLAPGDSVRYWTFAIKDPGRIGGLAFASNQSVNGELHRLGLDAATASVVWLGVCAVLGLAVAAAVWRLLRVGQDAAAAVLTGLVALFCSPVSWSHHWVWSVPLVVVLLAWADRADDHRRLWAVLAGVGVVVFLTTPQWLFPHEQDRELHWGPVAHLLGNAYLWWAIALVVAVLVWPPRNRLDRSVDNFSEFHR